MRYQQAYRSFINSRNVSEGLRITAGIALPSFVMSYLDMLATGIVMSVGALCVAATDNPGPAHHRSNGMFACNGLIFFTAIIIGLGFHFTILLGIILFVLCFIFSMLGVYGTRESSIGLAALLVMVLNLQHPRQGWDIGLNAIYILAGGVWYMIFSLTLHRLRPYKIIQQSLGDYIQSIADYLRERSMFYSQDVIYNEAYHELFIKQTHLQEEQNIVSELLFKTRNIVEESTPKGRILLMIYLEAADVFERAIASYNYQLLHKYFDGTDILHQCKAMLVRLSDELEEIGIAIKSGIPSQPNDEIAIGMKKLRENYSTHRINYMTAENLEGFVSMGRIIESLSDFTEKINILHHYTSNNVRLKKQSAKPVSYEKFVDHKAIDPRIFFDNLNFQSNIFRHSLRVSVAVLTGYIVSLLFNTGHSYWILLTIVVILKPAYSLTKKRNIDRLIGTMCGIIAGVIIIFLIKNNTLLLVLMLLLMAGCYIFLRTNYFISVLLMTPYLLIFFHLLYPDNFKILLQDRIIDTAIGSVIAFITSIFFIPAWEHTTIKTYMIKMLEDNRKYFRVTASAFYEDKPLLPDQLTLARRDAFVALANLSDAFTRMLSEPKRQQKGIENIHRFVVLNHTLTSHIATLSYYSQTKKNFFRSASIGPVVKEISNYFMNTIERLDHNDSAIITGAKESLRSLNDHAEILMEKRKSEIEEGMIETDTKTLLVQTKPITDQFNYIYSIAEDINKICAELQPA